MTIDPTQHGAYLKALLHFDEVLQQIDKSQQKYTASGSGTCRYSSEQHYAIAAHWNVVMGVLKVQEQFA